MKAFLVSIVLLIAISWGAAAYLGQTPMSSQDIYSSGSVRLN